MILCFKKGDCPGLHTDETLLVYTEYRYRGERFMKTLRRKKRWPRKSTTKPRRYNGSGKRYQAVSAIHRGGAKNMGQKRVSWYEKAKGCWYISEDNRTATFQKTTGQQIVPRKARVKAKGVCSSNAWILGFFSQ